ncbi:MAG: hypothetical protein OEZ06_19190 [Myxococcales bacterium]|nr:hypothetical protein [Myxococcales bacterium]
MGAEPIDGPTAETVGAFALEQRLASSELGETFRAYDKGLGRKVLLTRLLPEVALRAGVVEAFMQRARALMGVAHPAIPSAALQGDELGLPMMVCPLPAAEPLSSRLESAFGMGLPLRTVRPVVSGVAEALAALHDRGLVHGRLTVASVYLEGERALLIDLPLGGGKPVLDADADAVRRVAPERLLGGAADRAGDSFALGALLYELLVGRPPPGTGASPADAAPHVPPELAELVARCLSSDAGARPSLAEAFRVLSGEAAGPRAEDEGLSFDSDPDAPGAATSSGRPVARIALSRSSRPAAPEDMEAMAPMPAIPPQPPLPTIESDRPIVDPLPSEADAGAGRGTSESPWSATLEGLGHGDVVASGRSPLAPSLGHGLADDGPSDALEFDFGGEAAPSALARPATAAHDRLPGGGLEFAFGETLPGASALPPLPSPASAAPPRASRPSQPQARRSRPSLGLATAGTLAVSRPPAPPAASRAPRPPATSRAPVPPTISRAPAPPVPSRPPSRPPSPAESADVIDRSLFGNDLPTGSWGAQAHGLASLQPLPSQAADDDDKPDLRTRLLGRRSRRRRVSREHEDAVGLGGGEVMLAALWVVLAALTAPFMCSLTLGGAGRLWGVPGLFVGLTVAMCSAALGRQLLPLARELGRPSLWAALWGVSGFALLSVFFTVDDLLPRVFGDLEGPLRIGVAASAVIAALALALSAMRALGDPQNIFMMVLLGLLALQSLGGSYWVVSRSLRLAAGESPAQLYGAAERPAAAPAGNDRP